MIHIKIQALSRPVIAAMVLVFLISPAWCAESGIAMPSSSAVDCSPEGVAAFYQMDGQKLAQIKITATGYGAPPKSAYPEPQRRLMTMRAAQVDAYRSLAERVNGMRIWGGTTIGDMVVEKDRYRVFLDSYLKGAKLAATHPIEDGTQEAVVELVLDQSFIRAALGLKPCPEYLRGNIPMPSPGFGISEERTAPVTSATSDNAKTTAPSSAPAASSNSAPVGVAPMAPVMPSAEKTAQAGEPPAASTIPLPQSENSSLTPLPPAASADGKKASKSSLYFSEDE